MRKTKKKKKIKKKFYQTKSFLSISIILLLSVTLIILLLLCTDRSAQTEKTYHINSKEIINENSTDSMTFKEYNSSEIVNNIKYNMTTQNDNVNNIISLFEKENVEIFYNNQLGFFDYAEDPELMNEDIFGTNSTMITFNTKKVNSTSVNTQIISIPDYTIYNNLKLRYENPDQTEFKNQLVLFDNYIFNDSKQLVLLQSEDTDEIIWNKLSKIIKDY